MLRSTGPVRERNFLHCLFVLRMTPNIPVMWNGPSGLRGVVMRPFCKMFEDATSQKANGGPTWMKPTTVMTHISGLANSLGVTVTSELLVFPIQDLPSFYR